MSKTLRWISITVVAVLLGTVLIRALGQGRNGPPGHGDGNSIRVPSHLTVENGATVVTLNTRAQARAGIAVATLKKARSRAIATAPARVLPADALASLRDEYVAGQNRMKKAEIASGVEQREYQRLKTLFAENQNVSAKAVQAAQGQLLSDQADLATARQQLDLERLGVRQSWGGVVAEWVATNSPSLQRVLNQQDVLVEVTIPSGQKPVTPRSVQLEVPAGGSVTADFVSPFPRVDPRIQGVSLLYLAPASPGLVPGVNPVARFGVGRLESGVVVPPSSVVWWQGKAWAYLETSPGHFTRRQVDTGSPVGTGYFMAGLAAGDRIVVQGAQILLSTELAPQRESAGGEDTD